MTCVGTDGYPLTKAVVPAKHRESISEMYFCTNTSSKFANAVSKNPKSNVYFYSRKLIWKGCMVKGKMEIVFDLAVKKKYWLNKFKNAYPEKSYTDPDFCVLRFVSESGRFYPNIKEREKAINEYIDDWEKNNLGSENADKPIVTQYDDQSSIDGKHRSGIIIEPLKNTDSHTDNLITSATANSEIMFALMINPNILGAAMPGGTYAGNQGGSNIREGFLVKIATSWLDRQNLLDPIYLMLRYNGYDDVVIRYRNTILTTLDTGAGTQKNLA